MSRTRARNELDVGRFLSGELQDRTAEMLWNCGIGLWISTSEGGGRSSIELPAYRNRFAGETSTFRRRRLGEGLDQVLARQAKLDTRVKCAFGLEGRVRGRPDAEVLKLTARIPGEGFKGGH